MNDIGQWLVSAGQTLLAETSIGTTTDQAEALLREHEAIELKCRVTVCVCVCVCLCKPVYNYLCEFGRKEGVSTSSWFRSSLLIFDRLTCLSLVDPFFLITVYL
ncbi:hypothetical protein OTU49_016870, partial [Cherax quadricarinatus]